MDTKAVDTKTKIITAITQAAFTLAFVGYCFALYKRNDNNISFYSNFILILGCFSNIFYGRKKVENKFLDTLVKVNGVLLVIWFISVIVRLFI